MIPQPAFTPRRPDTGRHPNRILVVDDDPVVQVLLRETLLTEGYDVSGAGNSEEAEQQLRQSPWDLVILDRRLPDADGLLLLKTVKERAGCPVIILSVMDDQHDRTLGLGLGAQDYIAKPFSASEILLRIRNLLATRNTALLPARAQELAQGPFRLVQTTRRLTMGGATHQLTSAEARLLAVFLTHPGEVLDRTLLTRSICQREWSHNDRSIDVLVARLRKHIETDPKSPEWIVTVHGAGYLFSAEAPCRPC